MYCSQFVICWMCVADKRFRACACIMRSKWASSLCGICIEWKCLFSFTLISLYTFISQNPLNWSFFFILFFFFLNTHHIYTHIQRDLIVMDHSTDEKRISTKLIKSKYTPHTFLSKSIFWFNSCVSLIHYGQIIKYTNW